MADVWQLVLSSKKNLYKNLFFYSPRCNRNKRKKSTWMNSNKLLFFVYVLWLRDYKIWHQSLQSRITKQLIRLILMLLMLWDNTLKTNQLTFSSLWWWDTSKNVTIKTWHHKTKRWWRSFWMCFSTRNYPILLQRRILKKGKDFNSFFQLLACMLKNLVFWKKIS